MAVFASQKWSRWNGTSWDDITFLPEAHTHKGADINDASPVYYVVGNTSGTAGTWTGSIPNLAAYYDGLTIAFKLGIDGASTTTLNINGLGAKTVRRNTGGLTTHLPINSVVVLVYTTISGTSYWVWADYDSDSNYDLRSQYQYQIGDQAIYSYKILAEGSDGKLYPLTLETGTGTTKTVSTKSLKLGGVLLAYSSSTTIAANTLGGGRYYLFDAYNIGGALHYTLNSSSGFTAGLPLYLKGVIQADGSFKLDNTSYTSFYTQTLPTTDDGFVYILLGFMNDTTTSLRLTPTHPIYQFKDGKFRMLVPEHLHSYLPTAGGVMGGDITIQGYKLKNDDYSYIEQDGQTVSVWCDNTWVMQINAGGNTHDMKSHKLVNVTDPTAAQDAATKNYADTRYSETVIGTVTSRGGSVNTTIFAATYNCFKVRIKTTYNTSYHTYIIFDFVPSLVPYTGGGSYQGMKMIVPLYGNDVTSSTSYQKPVTFYQTTAGTITVNWNTTTTYGDVTEVAFIGVKS